jgi:hypothetical protein
MRLSHRMWSVVGSYQQFVRVCFIRLHDRGKGNLTLNIEATGSSESFVIFHHSAWSRILEGSNLQCIIYFHGERNSIWVKHFTRTFTIHLM